MAASQDHDNQGKKVGEMYAVCPRKDCPHVQPLVSSVENLQIDVSLPCKDCNNKGENWLCLSCSEVYCSRYVNSHMVGHNERDPTHMICLSFSDLSFWCYQCDSYIVSPVIKNISKAAEFAKFDVLPNIACPEPLQGNRSQMPSSTNVETQDQGSRATEEAKHVDLKDPNCDTGAEDKFTSESTDKKRVFDVKSDLPKDILLSRIRAVLYGNCIGDAIGLLTEFMTKKEALAIYDEKAKASKGKFFSKKSRAEELQLEYSMKYDDFHRYRWEAGDWTDDSDQMILILRTLLECNGKADECVFAGKIREWSNKGFKELGDLGGMGIGRTTHKVINNKLFLEDPHKCAYDWWEMNGRWVAPNGAVMRTSILGIQDFSNIETVIKNTRQIAKVTHADPRCIASCVAVTTAIALMLQGKHCHGDDYLFNAKDISKQAYEYACKELESAEQKKELHDHMFASSLEKLELDGEGKIGYTYKCLGAGFWAFRQNDFRLALTKVIMEAGDADTNGAVAGALLGCKLGVENLPDSWLSGLIHKEWLDKQIDEYFSMLGLGM